MKAFASKSTKNCHTLFQFFLALAPNHRNLNAKYKEFYNSKKCKSFARREIPRKEGKQFFVSTLWCKNFSLITHTQYIHSITTQRPHPPFQPVLKLVTEVFTYPLIFCSNILDFPKTRGAHKGLCGIILWCKILNYIDMSRRFQHKRRFEKFRVINEGICVKEYKKLSYLIPVFFGSRAKSSQLERKI